MSLTEVASTVPILEKLKDQGSTVIIIEHRLKELFRVADRILVMNFGRKIAEETPEKILDNQEVKKAYLGTEIEMVVKR
jgi:branched-chain amino acid transport system ATP-binding protein